MCSYSLVSIYMYTSVHVYVYVYVYVYTHMQGSPLWERLIGPNLWPDPHLPAAQVHMHTLIFTERIHVYVCVCTCTQEPRERHVTYQKVTYQKVTSRMKESWHIRLEGTRCVSSVTFETYGWVTLSRYASCHTHIHMYAHTHALTNALTHPRSLSRPHKYTRTHAHIYTRTHTHTHTHAPPPALSLSLSHSHSLARAPALTHTHTHTYTHRVFGQNWKVWPTSWQRLGHDW